MLHRLNSKQLNNIADSLSVLTEAERGEIPHEWVTVMPPREDKSDTLSCW